MYKYKNNCKKLKYEVGMAMPKSTQTRVVGIITYMVHPHAYFLVMVCVVVGYILARIDLKLINI